MNQEQWLSCTDLHAMLEFLMRKTSERKMRLFAVACCRQIGRLISHLDSQRAVEISEEFADGRTTAAELQKAVRKANAVASDLGFEATLRMRLSGYAAKDAARAAAEVGRKRLSPGLVAAAARAAVMATPRKPEDQCGLLREIVGLLSFKETAIDPTWFAWNAGTVLRLAREVYQDRQLPGETLDNGRLAILADALEEAGCQDPDILGHCREQGRVHVRGCWVLDLLLNKD